MSAADLAGMRITKARRFVDFVAQQGGGYGFAKLAKKSLASAGAVGLLTMPGESTEDYVRGGRAVQRVWLTCGTRGQR